MKFIYSFFSLVLFVSNWAYSQTLPSNLTQKKWGVKAYYSQYRGQNYSFYNKDSVNNVTDYSIVNYDFDATGEYASYQEEKEIFRGVWFINPKMDSIYLDQIPKYLSKIDNENIIIRSYELQFADTSARLDTVYSYLHLYPLSDVINSLVDADIEMGIVIFPNPIKGVLNVKWTNNLGENITNIRLTNTMGQVVKNYNTEKSVSSFSVDLNQLNSGIYTLEAIDTEGKRVAIKKVLKE